MRIAEFAHPAEVTWRRSETAAGRATHGLGHERDDIFTADARDRIVDLSHKAGTAGRRAAHTGLEKGDEAREAGLRLARKAVKAVARRLD